MGYVPKTTKADIKLFMGFTVKRIVVTFFTVFFTFSIAEKITTSTVAQIIASVIALVIALWLSAKSPSNPNQTYIKGLLNFVLYFLEPRKLYGNNSEEVILLKEKEAAINAKRKAKEKND